MKRTSPSIVSLAGLALLVACDDSATGNTGDQLTADEATAVAAEITTLLQLVDIALFDQPSTATTPAAVPYGELYDDEIDALDACDGGGTGSIVGLITGDVDTEGGTADLDIDATVDFDGCALSGETTTVTVDGNPDVDVSADIVFGQTAATIDVDVDGGVSYDTSDGRSGTCALDMTFAVTLTEVGTTETLTGTACGVNASAFDIQLVTD